MVTAGGAAAGGPAGAAAAAIAQAIKASGAIVRVEPEEFEKVLARAEAPLVVTAESRFLRTTYKYLTSYKGLAFFTKARYPLALTGCEIVAARSIWIPG
jgi:glycerate kinase